MDTSEVARHWEANAEAWTRHARAGYDVYRDTLNTPAFFAILPSVAGLKGLDVGCGEGSNTRRLAKQGAVMTAVDVAPTFVRHAAASERANSLGIRYQVADGTRLPLRDCTFDFVTAFMSLMDMPDQQVALGEASRVLKPGGFLQFSILHPCFAPPHRRVLRNVLGHARAIEVGRYFEGVDGEVESWWFSAAPSKERKKVQPFQVPQFHRTLSEWVDMIVGTGMAIEKLNEPTASAELAQAHPLVADTRVAPLFLHVRARKA